LLDSPENDLLEFDDAELDELLARAAARSRAMRARRRRLGALAGSCAATVALVLALTFALPRSGSGEPPGAAPPVLVRGGHPVQPLRWQLVSERIGPWRPISTPKNPPRFDLECPSDRACYTLGWVADGSQTIVQLVVTNDGGDSWAALTLPTEIGVNASFSCASAETCAVLGLDLAGSPTFLTTTDGGQTWSAGPGPSEFDANVLVNALDCVSVNSCTAVGWSLSDQASALTMSTSDGGSTWSASALPSSFDPTYLQCLAGGTCALAGFDTADGSGAAAYSADGGVTWTQASVPAGTDTVRGVSCSDPSDCLASSFAGEEKRPGGPSPATTILRSTDGGRTWNDVAATGLPAALLTDISCPVSTYCWASGAIVPQGSGGAVPVADAQGMLALSTDQGQSWQTAQLPAGVRAILRVSCPSTDACYALSVLQSPNGQESFGLLTNAR
jgi:photosystem II stability/assembly factor-like uncharacterized protein